MAINPDAEILRLRTALRDIVALSIIPAAWVGREPPEIAARLADVLVGSLYLDFAFVRLCDPNGGAAVEVTRGDTWEAFPEWLERHLAAGSNFSRKEIIQNVGSGAKSCRGIVIPIGVNAEGGVVAAACDRADFPTEIDQLLLSTAANHAATAFQNSRLIHERRRAEHALRENEQELRQARNELEIKVAERTAELRRSEAYLAEAQRLTHTGSWAFSPITGKPLYWSDEMFRIWGFDPQHGPPDPEAVSQRIHPEDRQRMHEPFESGFEDHLTLDVVADHRILLPDGTLKYIHGISHPVFDDAGQLVEYVGTAVDVTERKRAKAERQAHFWFLESMDRINRAIQGTNDLEQMMGDVLDVVIAIFACDRAWLVYPCDPQSPSWRTAMERTTPEFPGASAHGGDLPVDAEVANVFRLVRASSGAVRFGAEADTLVLDVLAERFSVRSQICMAVYPKGDRPYMFGLHQCTHARVWTDEEEALFEAIGRRLTDTLTSLLMFRNLQESEARLREAQRIAQVGYWDRDLETDRISWSDQAYRIFGLPPQERAIDFAAVQELTHPEDQQIVARAVTEALRGDARYDIEYRVVRPGGEVRIVHSQSDVTRDELGRPRRMFGTIQDITERRRAEDELRASERNLRLLIETIPGMICRGSATGEIEYVNQRVLDYTGKTLEDVAGFGWASVLHPDDAERVLSTYLQSIATGQTHEVEYRLRRRDGTYRWFQSRADPLRDSEGRVINWYGLLYDIEDRKNAEAILRKTEVELAHATRVMTMGELVASIAHEVNQPLGAIVTNGHACVRLLSREVPDLERSLEVIGRMIKDGMRASEVIKRIRELMHKSPAEMALLNINETIEEVVALVSSDILRNKIELNADLQADLPLVLGDRIQLQQVVLNLILNAKDAMSGEQMHPRDLQITTRKTGSDGILVAVRDTGHGLNGNDVERIFEPFFTTKAEGMGLGLSISRTIIETHGGTLWATRNEDRGATIQFALPGNSESES